MSVEKSNDMNRVRPFSEELTEKDRHGFRHKMRWLLTCLQVCGLYLGPKPRTWDFNEKTSSRRNMCKVIMQKLYCFLMVSYPVGYYAVLAYRFQYVVIFTPEWIQHYNSIVWCTAIVIWTITPLLGFGQGHLYHWCHSVHEYEKEFGLHKKLDGYLRKMPIIVFSNLIMSVMAAVLYLLVIGKMPFLAKYLFLFRQDQVWENNIMALILILFHNSTMGCIILTIFLATVCLCFELDRVNEQFQPCLDSFCRQSLKPISTQVEQDPEAQVAELIRQHLHICRLIDSFNNCTKHLTAATFLLSLPISCFSLYLILTGIDTTQELAITAFSISIIFMPVFLMCILGCTINTKAHRSLTYIWQIPTSSLTEKTMRELMMFTSRLTGTTIGFTVYGFFTINMPAVLSTLGTILTYFIVVIQFKPSDTGHQYNETLLYNLSQYFQALQNHA